MPRYETSWWKYTGEYAPVVNGISSPILMNLETGELLSGRELPVGALWDCNEPPDGDRTKRRYFYPTGQDGRSIACRLPDGSDWHIDGRASNCTKPGDDGHRCWVRHGTVGDKLTVDKNGLTCAAGAGSIAVPGYHGFLRNGELVDA